MDDYANHRAGRKKPVTLAVYLSQYEDELRADLQQTYNICLDDAKRGRYTPAHILCLIKQLPLNSRLARRLDNKNAWSFEEILLGLIATSIRDFMYSLSGSKGKRPPAVLPDRMVQKNQKKKLQASTVSMEEMKQHLQNKGYTL